jgi:predicted Zn-dependent protease
MHRCAVCLLALCTALAAGEPEAKPAPKPAVKLNNDAVYQAKLQAILDAAPAKDAPADERANYFSSLMYAQYIMRQYAQAESTARELLKLLPDNPMCHSSLSVFLGKQGKLREAEEAARKALELDPASLHAKLVLPSWIYEQGRKDEALKLFAAIAAPAEESAQSLHHGCSACFYASVGDETKLEAAVKQAIEKDAETKPFFERDIAFDPYRGKDWFIKLVGKTLAEPAPNKP